MGDGIENFIRVEATETDRPMRQRSEDRYGRLVLLPEIRFAHAAASRLREPAPPLITLFGPSGVGKSHLVQQIVRELRAEQPSLRVVQVTAGEFLAEFMKASKTGSIPHFQESHRSLDLFVCEDLQSLEGRSEVQQQVLAIVDAILGRPGRVLLTSSRSPGSLRQFSPRLRSRCLGGVCAGLELPGPSSRQQLITQFAAELGCPISAETTLLLAESLAVSPRELRGAVLRAEHRARQHRRPIDREIARQIVDETIVPEKPTLSQITRVVARTFSVSANDLRSQDRLQGHVLPRQLAMFAAREWSHRSYSEIGRHFHRRSHSTIVHACQRVRALLETDTDFCRLVESIREQLNLSEPISSAVSTTC